jgi:hydrogenase nickel incorporation protein HypB
MKHEITSMPANQLAATKNQEDLAWSKVLAIALIGPPGAGKTALLEATARQVRGEARMAVIVVNPAAERDADRVSRYCSKVLPVNAATPDASAVRAALGKIDLSQIDLLFIESMGGIGGAPDFGQDATVTVLSVSGGEDKAAEYAGLVAESPVVILSKAELQRHVMFDRGAFRVDVRRINPQAELMEISAFENKGLERWLEWLDQRRQEKDPRHRPTEVRSDSTETFYG